MQDAGEVLLGEVESGGDDALVGGQVHRSLLGQLFLVRQVPQQVADDALAAGVQGIGLHVGDDLVQAHGKAGDHLAPQFRVPFQFAEQGRLGNVQQLGVGEGLGIDDIGLVHEHQGFAEGLALTQDFHHLFAALGGRERQLHLAIDHQMHAVAGITLVEQHVASGGMDFPGTPGDPGNFVRRQAVEHGHVGEEGVDVQVAGGHGRGVPVVAKGP